jgi:hypothetical protein
MPSLLKRLKEIQPKLPWAPRPRKRTEAAPLEDIPSFGSSPTKKDKHTFRVGLHNIHGLQKSKELIGSEEMGGIKTLGVDLMAIVELNNNCTLDVREAFNAAANLCLRPARTVMASSWALEEGYMPGGVATVVNGNVCGRVHNKGADKLGRFTWMALRGKNATGIIVVTAYRVCQKAGTNAGNDTAYMQQYVAMREQGIKKPDPRNQILSDISDILMEWGQKGYRPLVLMDANSTVEDPHIQEFMEQHGLEDLIPATNPGKPPSTYARGPNRIDLVLGDSFVKRAVIKSGALALHDGITSSDHTMQFVDLDERLLFRDDSFIPMAGFKREFRLYDTKKKAQFQEKLLEIYDHQQIPKRADKLIEKLRRAGEATPELVDEYERLDDEVVRAILSAAAATGRKDFGYQRSPALINAGLTIRLHKAIRSCILRGFRFNEMIKRLAATLKYCLPNHESISPNEAHANLNEAWKQKREIEREDAEKRACWLEEIAEEKALEKGTEADKELKSMIAAARSRAMYKRLRAILKPEWSALDYIEVPTKHWYLTKSGDELYEFNEGIFLAHSGGAMITYSTNIPMRRFLQRKFMQ